MSITWYITKRGCDCGYDNWNMSVVYVKHVFRNGQPTRDGVRKIFERLILTSSLGTLRLIAYL